MPRSKRSELSDCHLLHLHLLAGNGWGKMAAVIWKAEVEAIERKSQFSKPLFPYLPGDTARLAMKLRRKDVLKEVSGF